MRSWKKYSALLGCVWMMSAGAAQAFGLFSGDAGESVRALQKILTHAGTRVVADGCSGKETQAAIRQFQLKNGLMADGVMGQFTYRILTGMVESSYATVTEDIGERAMNHYHLRPKKPQAAVNLMANELAVLRDAKVRALMAEAEKYIGTPYVFGGTTPGGFDCSGFLQYIFRKQGMGIPRLADEQYEIGEEVGWSALKPGDLVFFTTYEEGASHSGLYIGDGNFISATNSGVKIYDMTSGYWRDRYLGAKRVI